METLYWFCTDFVIAVSNLTGLSYNEVNGLLFAVVFPAYLVGIWSAALLVSRKRG
jgi:hypothetical protein